MGDYAKNIAMRVATLEEIPETSIKNDILRLLTLVQIQLKKVIDAYVSQDIDKAKEVIESDIQIDNHYNAAYDKIVDLIKGKVSKLRLLTTQTTICYQDSRGREIILKTSLKKYTL